MKCKTVSVTVLISLFFLIEIVFAQTMFSSVSKDGDILHYQPANESVTKQVSAPLEWKNIRGWEIVEIAIRELGRGPWEVGKEISYYPFDLDRYLRPGEAWCSEFVSWCYKVAGTPFTGGYEGGWMLKGSKSIRSWFRTHRSFIDKNHPDWLTFTPAPGDYIRYDNESGGHSGVVRYESNDTLYTVEGNVGNRVKLRALPNWRGIANIDGIGIRVVDAEAYFAYKNHTDNLYVEFFDKSFARKGSIQYRFWDFGDGHTATEPNPSHVYTSAGSYQVTLTIVTNASPPDTAHYTIPVEVPKPRYPLTVQVVGKGEVTLDPPEGQYEAGTWVTLRANPDTAWRFERWSGDHFSLWNPLMIRMDASKTITAMFVEVMNYVGHKTAFPRISVAKNRRAMPFIMPEDGLIGSISIFHEKGTGRMILGVYNDLNNRPYQLLGATPSTQVRGVRGWQKVPLTEEVFVRAGEKIWLAWVFEENPGVRYQEGTPGRVDAEIGWDGGMPEFFGNGTQRDYIYSIYANYTASTQVAQDPRLPEEMTLHPPFPNPFNPKNPTTHIVFDLTNPEQVHAVIYNQLGRRVRELLVGQNLQPGTHHLIWDGRDNQRKLCASGIYFIELRVKDALYRKKILFLH